MATNSLDDSFSNFDDNADLDYCFTEEDRREFNEEVQNMQKKVSVLCGGPVGVGKSTLLNGIVGEDTDKFHVENSLSRGTSGVLEKTFVKNDIQVTLWDTPGLEGRDDVDKGYLREIKEKCADFDVFLYCIKSTETKATELFDEKSSLVHFTKVFGPELWENAVVLLTQANGVEAKLEQCREVKPSLDIEKSFNEKITEWKVRVRKELEKMGVSKRTAKKVPVLPAGSATSPHLPGHQFWLSKIFEKVTDRMKYKAKLAYLQLSKDRLKQKEDVNEETISSTAIQDQPFVVSRKDKWLIGFLSSGAGLAGAATGAGIGATIGALLIGIPSFGAFAGGGLVLGGAIGGLIGGGASVATALAVKYFKKRKHEKEMRSRQESQD